ncbi:MAG: Ig-like domain-containing protein [Aeromicrobium sp.]|uniref:L,D-transpeptidase n=1 Tax=Aeromicrobium sp. TaxID=1871063 RepID=UPI003C5CC887
MFPCPSAPARRLVAAFAAAAVVAAGCTPTSLTDGAGTASGSTEPLAWSANVKNDASDVGVDTIVSVTAEHGKIRQAVLRSAKGEDEVSGSVTGSRWVATERLEPSTTYELRVTGAGNDGREDTFASTFSTQSLTLAQQTYPAVAPLDGETVGVGMPVIVTFDVPVKNRALFERNMYVTSSADVEGSWSWFSDREAHYRPKEYWPAKTKVTVSLKLNGLPAGNGIFGQQDQDIDFRIGRKAVSVVNVAKKRLTFTVDDKKRRTIPVSNGDSTHRTRKGTKIIMEKFSSVDMDAATTGVDSDDPGYYNMTDVRWAMRVTNSGEFLHAAPWSAASHGRANVSHGCTGMSTADAGWLYQQSRRGDVVEYTNSSRGLEDRNGWTDWNDSWESWTKRSALYRTTPSV